MVRVRLSTQCVPAYLSTSRCCAGLRSVRVDRCLTGRSSFQLHIAKGFNVQQIQRYTWQIELYSGTLIEYHHPPPGHLSESSWVIALFYRSHPTQVRRARHLRSNTSSNFQTSEREHV